MLVMENQCNLMTLCNAALLVEERDAATSRKQNATLKETRKQAKEPKIEGTINNKGLFSTQTAKRYKGKLPNCNLDILYESTSDELNKKFSYRCKYSPTECSKVVKSYGSESKALSLIKDHIFEHIKNDPDEEIRNLWKPPKRLCSVKTAETVPQRGSNIENDPDEEICNLWQPPFLCSVKTAETVPQRGSNSGQSVQKPAEKVESEVDNLTFGQSEHDYAKSGDEPSLQNSVPEWKKKKRVNAAYDKLVVNFLARCITGQSYVMPSFVPTGPFPFVHHPESLEPAAVVEFYSTGEPVDVIQPAYVPSFELTRIGSKKKLETLCNKRKPKFSRAVDEVRSVLECVENRVACKPSAEPKDALVPHKGIENSENMEEIAKRHILILAQQKKKRRCRDKPSVHICQLCNKHFTANTSLTYHYLGHLNIKPFACLVCARTFTRRHSLNYHMMIHDGKNRFECSVCERQFRHPSHYKEHLRKHTGEEPYSCKFCSNNFKTRNSFKRHLRMQHQKLLTSNGIVPISEDN